MGWPNNFVQGVYGEDNQLIGIGDGLGGEHYLKDTNITTKRIKVGVNHMPGWAYGWGIPGGNGGPWPSDPWAHVASDRVPLKGAYQGYSQVVVDQQLREMRDYGIDFIMADWFFGLASGDSRTDNTYGTGSKTWIVLPGYDAKFQVGMKVSITGTLSLGDSILGIMTGLVTAYDYLTGSLTVNVAVNSGSGAAGVSYGDNSGWLINCTTDSSIGASTPVGTLDYFIKLWKASDVPGKPKLCLTWANTTNATHVNDAGWAAHFQNAIDGYFNDPDYLKINGKPVVGIIDWGISHTATSDNSVTGWNTRMNAARAATVAAGHSGLYIVAGQSSLVSYWTGIHNTSAADAIYALNVGYRSDGTNITTKAKNNFEGIDWNIFGSVEGGLYSWTDYLKASSAVTTYNKKIWTPISAGIDTNGWNPSSLYGTPTKEEFSAHLTKARKFIEDNYAYTDGFCVVQSWNEHIEGSVVEPNSSGGYTKLEQIRDILSC